MPVVPDQVAFDALAQAVAALRTDLTLLHARMTAVELALVAPPVVSPPIVVPPPIVIPPIVVVPPTGFAVPDLVNNASFETGWDGFVDWSFGSPGPANLGGFSCTRSQEHAKDGLWSVKSSFGPNGGDQHVEFGVPFAPQLDVTARVYFYLIGALPTTHRKWIRFQTAGYGGVQGGLYLSSLTGGVTWCDAANQQVDVDVGIGVPTFNAWHTIEVRYDRRDWAGPHGPRARFWYDGTVVVGPSPTKWFPGIATAYWGDEAGVANPAGPWLYAGAPSGRAAPSALLVFDDTINGGNAASGATFYDWIGVSTQRIGP